MRRESFDEFLKLQLTIKKCFFEHVKSKSYLKEVYLKMLKINGSKNKITISALLLVLSIGMANAFSLDSVTSLVAGGSNVDTGAISSSSVKLVGAYLITMVTINKAQAETLMAFGLEEKAEILMAHANSLGSGVSDQSDEDREKAVALTKEADEIINAEISKGAVLDGEGKGHLKAGLGLYALGTLSGTYLLTQVIDWGKGAMKAVTKLSSNPSKMVKFKNQIAPGIFVVSQLEDLLSSWSETNKNVIGYASTNGVELSDAEKQEAEDSADSLKEDF